METIENPNVSNSPAMVNETPEKEEKKSYVVDKQNTIPVMRPQFRMIASEDHKTLEYRYTEEVEHTMVMKDGVTWQELKQYDHNPISNGETVSPDVRKATVTQSIGYKKYQTSEVTTDGVMKIKQLSKLSDSDIENFKKDW